jgi:CheY-like chemotaxis protein
MKKMILLVEDNTDDIELTLRAFRKINVPCEVLVARDGVEALEMLTTGSGASPKANPLPDIILLDLKLPRVNGLEVLRHIKQHPRTRLIPVVMLTSSSERVDLIECYTSGANSYIRKPVDFAQFTEVLHQLGIYWLGINQAPHE